MTKKLNNMINNKKRFRVKKIRGKPLYALYDKNKEFSERMSYDEMIMYLEAYKL